MSSRVFLRIKRRNPLQYAEEATKGGAVSINRILKQLFDYQRFERNRTLQQIIDLIRFRYTGRGMDNGTADISDNTGRRREEE